MTYLDFHLLFIVGPTALLAVVAMRAAPRLGPRTPVALFGVAPLALIYTARWDQHLIAERVWWYGDDRVLGAWLGVPYEEYAFMLLQPILTGALLLALVSLRSEIPRRPPRNRSVLRTGILVGAVLLLVGIAGGVPALQAGGRWTYLGLIATWAMPPLGALVAASWPGLVLFAKESLLAWGGTTLYLCIVDRIAIDAGVWTIGEAASTGWLVGGLPLEEALFFAVTNGLVVAGAMLFLLPGLRTEGAEAISQ